MNTRVQFGNSLRQIVAALAPSVMVIVLLLSLGVRPANAAAQPHTAGAPLTIAAGPYLQNPSDHAMTIMWITNGNATGSVEFGEVNAGLKTASSSHHGLVDTNERVHKVVLTGLKPGTVYRYRVLSRPIDLAAYEAELGEAVQSEFREFRTFDTNKQDTSFLVFNDVHGNLSTFSDMLKVAGDQPYDFVALNGDTLSHIDGHDQIASLLDSAVASFASRTPLFWVRGNHETRGAYARQFPAYLDSPGGRYYYSFDQGPVHFIVLDAGEDKPDTDREYFGFADFHPYRLEQAAWLKDEVKSPAFQRAKYRVVLVHMPFPQVMSAGASETERRELEGMMDPNNAFGEILEASGIDLMISGHMHIPEIIAPQAGHNYPIVQGGGPDGKGRTVIRVSANPREMAVSVLQADGNSFGNLKIKPRR